MTAHAVRCGDHAGADDPEDAWEVTGFPSAAAALEYARRFVRAQVEDLRADTPDPAALREAYWQWGEYAETPGFDLRAWVEHCIATPATRRAEMDYEALDPGG